MNMNDTNGTVRINGKDMDYVCFGKGRKILSVIPGLSDGLASVKGKALILKGPYKPYLDEYTVYMFSRINSIPEGYSIKDMADDQYAALKELGIEKTVVLGVSQGGMIAQSLAIHHPDIITKLVMTVSAPKADELIKENVSRWMNMAHMGDHKTLMIDTAEKTYTEKHLKSLRHLYPVMGMIGKPKTYDRFLRNAQAILDFDETKEISSIICPVLIIGGSEDKTVGVCPSYEMHEKIKDSELYIYEGMGHGLYEEAKDFYERVFSFLDK